MLKKINKLFLRVCSFGVSQDTSEFEIDRIRVLNFASLLFGFLLILSGLTFLKFKATQIGTLAILSGGIFWSFFLIIKQRGSEFLKPIFFLFFYFNIYLYSSTLGQKAGIHYWFLAISLVAYIVFDIKDRRLLYAVLPGPILYAVLKMTYFSWSILPKQVIPDFMQFPLVVAMMLSSALIGLGALYYQLARNARLENLQADNIQKMKLLVAGLDDVVFVISPDLIFKEVWCRNDSRLFLPREKILGKACAEVVSSFIWSRIKGAFETAANKNKNVEIEYSTLTNGEQWWRLRVRPVHDAAGLLESFTVMLGDISEKVKLRHEIEFQQGYLVQSAKMTSLGEIAGGIAHEINNPLAIIYAKSSMLIEQVEDDALNIEKLKADLIKIHSTAGRISKIIKGLRMISRNTESDPLIIENLNQIINDTVELTLERLRQQTILLNVDCDKNFTLECRATEISQVLMNLIMNAGDAIASLEEKWINIKVSAVADQLRIAITDSGEGIAPAVVEKMMQPFYTTKEIGKGTGLGLSISKGIIECHQGQFAYEHRSKNTCFVILIPKRQFVTTQQAG